MYEEAIEYKNDLFKELERIGKGISSDKRIEILDLLTQSPKPVDKIAKEIGSTVANTSRHLQVLKESRLVATTKDGNHVIYRLRSPKITALIHLLTEIGEDELSEMKLIQNKSDHMTNVKTISLRDAKKDQGKSYLLDVRPRDEYQAGHVASAVNIPLDELTDRLDELPKDRPIIVYCRGRLCANSNIAARILNQSGYDAYSLNSSYYDWSQFN